MALPETRTKKADADNKTKKLKKPVRPKKVRKSLFNRWLFKLAAVALIIGCGVLLITTEKDCSEKEAEMVLIQSKIDAYNIENADLQRTLDSDDLSEYMERVALEERGYAYPDEYRFYDTSRD